MARINLSSAFASLRLAWGLTWDFVRVQADKIKADAADAQRRAENEALRQEEEAKQTAALAQRDYERELEEKLLALPPEPPASDPEAITVLVRSPKGQKFGRRCGQPYCLLFSMACEIPNQRKIV